MIKIGGIKSTLKSKTIYLNNTLKRNRKSRLSNVTNKGEGNKKYINPGFIGGKKYT